MKFIRGEGLVAEKTPDSDRGVALTRLMALSSEIANSAQRLYDTEQATVGMRLMEIADRLADEVGLLTDRSGYTVDEVIAPLWKEATVDTLHAA